MENPKRLRVVTETEHFGKFLQRWDFTRPGEEGAEDDFYMFGQKDWSIILALTPSGKVIYGRQFKHGAMKELDELPAGTALTGGTNPEEIIRDRMVRETGYNPRFLVYLGRQPTGTGYYIASRSSPTCAHLFLALACEKSQERERGDPHEQINAQLIGLVDWLKLVYSGQIEEFSSALASTIALPHLFARGLLTAQEHFDLSIIALISSYLEQIEKVHSDSRRTISEFNSPQMGFSVQQLVMKQVATVGNHYHAQKIESFWLRKGQGALKICRLDKNGNRLEEPQLIELNEGDVIQIPSLMAHTFELEAGSELCFFSSRPFDQSDMPAHVLEM